MTDRELMQEALDIILAAIKSGDWKVDGACDPDFVINALRARLSQPEPAECDGGQCGIGGYCKQCPKTKSDVPETAFGETKPVLYQVRGRPNWDTEPKWGEWKFCTEPVANDYKKTPVLHDWEYQVRSLYTTPPQREWQGLTEEEIREGNKDSWVTRQAWESAAWWAEAKLKEKNT
jgi:hypothetical protein